MKIILFLVARRSVKACLSAPTALFFRASRSRAAYQPVEDQKHQQLEKHRRTAKRRRSDAGKDTGLLSAAADLVSYFSGGGGVF